VSPELKRTIRTALQTAVAVAAVLPALAAWVQDSDAVSAAAPWLVPIAVSAGAVAAAVTRVMATPAVERLLDRVGLGLRDDGPSGPTAV
jgi:hypothetical protein